MAWRFATCPTRRSPVLVNATTEGVVRLPSALGITCGSPPSITATHEFVVPRSMPIIFAMIPSMVRCGGAGFGPSAWWISARGLDRDLAGLGLFGFRDGYFEHSVSIRRLDLVGLDRVVQLERALEGSVHTLDPVIGRVLLLFGPGLLAADHEPAVLEGDLDVLEPHSRQLQMKRVAVRLLLDVHRRMPDHGAAFVRPEPAAEHILHDAIQLILNRSEVADGIPTHDRVHGSLLLLSMGPAPGLGVQGFLPRYFAGPMPRGGYG